MGRQRDRQTIVPDRNRRGGRKLRGFDQLCELRSGGISRRSHAQILASYIAMIGIEPQ